MNSRIRNLQPVVARGLKLWDDVQRRFRRYADGKPELRFRCNLCGSTCWVAPEQLDRELTSCSRCGSTLRWRAIVAALSKELFGKGMVIPEFPHRPDLRGLGLSDEACYATGLAAKLGYLNTFYDTEPRFDIMNLDPAHIGQYDFIISSDVFEHVPPPAVRAFENARRLLRPGGVLIFSVPYRVEGETTEHFPELFDYELVRTSSSAVVKNRTRDGREQEFTDLVFHGGPGFTLEMRVFSLNGIQKCVKEAGFSHLEIYDKDDWDFGLCWKGATWSHVMAARV